MDRTRPLVTVFLLCILSLSVVLVFNPSTETAAFFEPVVDKEARLPGTEGGSAVPYGDPSLVSTSTFTTTLPVVMNHHRIRPACTPDSPFAITIAAIHQVDPDDGQDAAARALAEAAWLATIEESYPTLVDALVNSGACWTRVELNWAQIQPDPPPAPYDFSFFDSRLQLLAESGIQILAVVSQVPDWAGPDVLRGPIDVDKLDDFALFLTDLVSRYKQPPYNIHHWELVNEPDFTEDGRGWGLYGDRYADMLELAYQAIKGVDPGATVLMGGIAYDSFIEYGDDGGPFNRYFPDDVMAAGGGNFIDATNLHFFPAYAPEWERWTIGNEPTCGIVDDGEGPTYDTWGIDYIAKASHFDNRLQVCFGVDKPMWVTEMGEHGYAEDLPSLEQQARYVVQGYTRALAAGMTNITWFVLVSPPDDPFEQGLLYEDDWSPKPAFYTYQTLTAELTGYQYSHTLDASKVEGYVFRNGFGQEKTVAWSWGEALESGSLTFAPASGLRMVDRGGGVTLVEDGGVGDLDQTAGSVTIQLPAVPVVPDPALLSRYTAEPLIVSKW